MNEKLDMIKEGMNDNDILLFFKIDGVLHSVSVASEVDLKDKENWHLWLSLIAKDGWDIIINKLDEVK